jgi:predicted kinase
METLAPVLAEQARDVRHCHGDLHLGNVFLDGETPMLFDCIEFNDFYAIIPPLYDLAFLLMDLLARDERLLANRTLNAWIMARDSHRWPDVMRSLGALPLYLAMRAEIRAKTEARRPGGAQDARRYLDVALAAGHRHGGLARVIAIGGLSGTGKSTIARALVPLVGGAIGGVHLRSDEIRKRLLGVELDERLPPSAYTAEVSRRVYDTMTELARLAVGAGMAVVVDAVQAREAERHAIEDVARAAGVRFDGVWLEAPAAVLEARIAGRRGDVSDATVDVLQQQMGYALGALTWKRIDVSGGTEAVSAVVRAHLQLS